MKISRRMRKGYALALAFLLTLPCLIRIQTEAATAIDTSVKCSLTVSVGSSDYEEDFNEMSIPVSLYKVADVDSAGRYTSVDSFSQVDLTGISSTTTAEEWQNLAEEAKQCLSGAEAVGKTVVEKPESGAGEAQGVFKDLAVGMYLVVPEASYNADYTVKYEFTPYLTALPSSEYAMTGAGSDDWDYNPVIGLKAGGDPQYGKLNITKVLSNYNETLGRTSFVFQIEGKDETGAVVYSEVVSTTHEGAGSETVTLDKIPAGLDVTVTEVYSGASYTIVGSDSDSAFIWSDPAVEAGAGEEASVTFTNRYDGGNRGGYGVTNHFMSDGKEGWDCDNPTTQPEE
ncbi:MAG: hypothetical protein HFG94_06580 [Dorea sp.]|nr:hypothetical protein [Dorea sp.]